MTLIYTVWFIQILMSLLISYCSKVFPQIYIYALPRDHQQFINGSHTSKPHFAMSIVERIRSSPHYTNDGDKAHYYWIEGESSRSIDWVKMTHPWWNKTRDLGQPRHIMAPLYDHNAIEAFRKPENQHPYFRDLSLSSDWHPGSPNRTIIYLSYNGVSDGHYATGRSYDRQPCFTCFYPGLDIAIPVSENNACGPRCKSSLKELQETSVWGGRNIEGFKEMETGRSRENLLFFAGAVPFVPPLVSPLEDRTGRNGINFYYSNTSRWRIVTGNEKVKMGDEMLRSDFCFSPLGGFSGGQMDRYISSILRGCIPVMLNSSGHLPHQSFPFSLPFEEVIDWRRFSTLSDVHSLQDLAPQLECLRPHLKRLRRGMNKVWEKLLWTSIPLNQKMHYGQGLYLGEDGENDAFRTLMRVLARRVLNGYHPSNKAMERMKHKGWPCRSDESLEGRAKWHRSGYV